MDKKVGRSRGQQKAEYPLSSATGDRVKLAAKWSDRQVQPSRRKVSVTFLVTIARRHHVSGHIPVLEPGRTSEDHIGGEESYPYEAKGADQTQDQWWVTIWQNFNNT